MSNEANTKNIYLTCKEAAADIIAELDTSLDRDDASDAAYEKLHEWADSMTTYHSESWAIVEKACGSECDHGENYLYEVRGEDIYNGCDSIHQIMDRLAHAILIAHGRDELWEQFDTVAAEYGIWNYA